MHDEKHIKNKLKRSKKVETITLNEELDVERPLTDYQIADRADKEESKKWRIALYIIVGITLSALLFVAYYVNNYEIY